MRVKVPRAVHRYTTKYMYLGSDDLLKYRGSYCDMGVGMPGDVIDVDLPSYFYDTKGRDINDCVHSKITDAKFRIDDHIYSARLYGYGKYCYSRSPLDPSTDPNPLHAVPAEVLINDGAISIYIHPWLDARKGTYMRHNIDVQIAVCAIENDKPYVFSVSDQLQHYLDWNEVDLGQGWSTSYGHSNGVYNTKTHGSYTWPASMFEQIATLFGSETCWWRGYNRYYYFPDPSNFRLILDLIEHECRNLIRSGFDGHFKGWSRSSFSSRELRAALDPDVDKFFLLHENNIIAEGYPAQYVDPKGLTNYWLNVLTQEAYLDALNNMPRLNDNSISNVIELAGFIKSIVIDHEIQIPKSLSSLWLAYRYQYQTTKLDTEEAISFVRRNLQLGTLFKTLSCYGVSSRTVKRDWLEADVVCRCCCDITPKDVKTLEEIWRALYTYGLQPSFYVIWDSIPYSFVVDWFIPIGNLANTLDAERMYSGTYYDISNVCYSLTYDIVDEFGNTHHQYTRWAGGEQRVLNGFYSLEIEQASQKVIGMRILDSLSLFIGKG